jgi:zinc transport system substrate-binding protein
MGIKFKLTFMLFTLVLFPWSLSSAQPPSEPKVVASLFPLQEFARGVGGDKVQVVLLLPPGAEAHTWEPRPSDVVRISRADIFIYVSPILEPWIDKVLRAVQSKKLRVLEASQGLPLIKAEETEERAGRAGGSRGPEKMDPHLWLDFALDQKIVEAIAETFSEKDPVHAAFYKNNAEIYRGKLNDLDQRYRQALAKCRHRQILLSGHAAFAYLAKRYGLRQIALSGISPDAEPTPKKMAGVIETAHKTGIKFIYVEELVNPKLAQVLSKEAGVGVLILNAGHNLTPQQVKQKVTFLELMQKNLENLVKGLECQ